VYVSREFRASVSHTEIARFTCASCAFTGEVMARGEGQGVAEAPFFIGQQSAATNAQKIASKSAAKDAQELISLACCPKCSVRDRAAVRRAYVRRWTAFFWSPLFMMMFMAALMYAAYRLDPPADHPGRAGDVVLGVFVVSCVLGLGASFLLIHVRVGRQLRRTTSELVIR
jgi:hypothetical protein